MMLFCRHLCVLTLSLASFSFSSFSQVPKVSMGTIQHYENFYSKNVTPRNVDVWLPPRYNSKTRYPVIYMHDGQMLFDSSITWNRQEWDADAAMYNLIRDFKIPPCIVVGIWNVPAERFADYFPEKALRMMPQNIQEGIIVNDLKIPPRGDEYLRFIVNELKPFIDNAFSTKSNWKNTYIAGSSMGGLISAYAVCEYPNVFAGAACLSLHSPMLLPNHVDSTTDERAGKYFREYLMKALPKADTRKFYFDYGDKTLDSLYAPYQKKIDDIMRAKGYTSSKWLTRFIPGADHSEASWRRRWPEVAEWLLR